MKAAGRAPGAGAPPNAAPAQGWIEPHTGATYGPPGTGGCGGERPDAAAMLWNAAAMLWNAAADAMAWGALMRDHA